MWRWGASGVRVLHWGGGLLIVHCTHTRLAGLQSSPDSVPPLSSSQERCFTCVCYMPTLPGFCASHLGPSSHLYNKRFAYRATSLAPNCIKQPVISWFRFDIYLFLTSRQTAIITVLLKVGVISETRTWEWQGPEAVATGLQVSRAVSELRGCYCLNYLMQWCPEPANVQTVGKTAGLLCSEEREPERNGPQGLMGADFIPGPLMSAWFLSVLV